MDLNLDFSTHFMTMLYSTHSNEQGFIVQTNIKADSYVQDFYGLTLGVRRGVLKPTWMKILGKTLPHSYPLIRHLIDSASVASELWDASLSDQQKRTITSGFSFSEDLTEDAKQAIVRKFVVSCAGLHDIGKATPDWQRGTLKLDADDPSLVDEITGKTLPMVKQAADAHRQHHINGEVFFSVRQGSQISGMVARDALATIVRAHHGVFDRGNPRIYQRDWRKFLHEDWVEDQKRIEAEMLKLMHVDTNDFASITNIDSPMLILIEGVVILADWIASRSDFIQSMDSQSSLEEHLKKSHEHAHGLMAEYGLEKAHWKNEVSWSTMFPDYVPNPLQQSLVEHFEGGEVKPGLLLINAPMGSGKTEASLHVSGVVGRHLGTNGMWMTLPTQATTDIMFSRATEIAEQVFEADRHTVALMHANSAISSVVEGINKKQHDTKKIASNFVSSHELIDDGDAKHSEDTNLFISEFLVEKKLGGMSTVAVSTVDQLINASTKLKHNALRWLAISGKVVVFDEVHDFDEYTFGLIKRAIQWCGVFKIPVVVMSATLSGEAQREVAEAYYGHYIQKGSEEVRTTTRTLIHELLPFDGLRSPEWVHMPVEDPHTAVSSGALEQESYTPYTTSIVPTASFVGQAKELAKEHSSQGANVLIVCSTVNQAIATYRSLQSDATGIPIALLHSRMPQRMKNSIIKDLLASTGKPPKEGLPDPGRHGQIVVSTQIVQQSMDIDLDVLITPAVPLPEMFQRVGRIYRHDQGNRRSAAYHNNPRIFILPEKGIYNFITQGDVDFSETSHASLIPYTSWQILSSLYILHKHLTELPDNKWDAKGSMEQIFAAHARLKKSIIDKIDFGSGKTFETLSGFYKNHLTEIIIKRDKADVVIIESPSETMDLKETGSNFTSRSSKAAPTRLINPQVSLLPLWRTPDGQGWALSEDGSDRVPPLFTMDFLKKIGLNCINVSNYFAEKYFEQIVESNDAIPDYIFPFDMSSVSCDILVDDVEGLALIEIVENKFTWL